MSNQNSKTASHSYDAILIVAFGGPEGMDDVIPFLENVLEGRNVPRERLVEVSHHYELFDGVSPINQQNRALIAALEEELAQHGPQLPIYWGNRNWHPLLTDTVQQMQEDGVRRVLAFFTSMYSCYSGCRQYREDLYRASEVVGSGAPEFDKIRMAYNHPLFIEANADRVRAALEQIPTERRNETQLVFTAHSIPLAMARNSRYEDQLQETCRLVAEALDHDNWTLVYQSRSGPPHQPWLEPDICDYLEEQHQQGMRDVVVAPIGFISDHMEVIYDLDTEARELVDEIGLNMVRAETVGVHPAFIRMIRELIVERMTEGAERRAMGRYPASHDVCAANCCLSGRPGEPLPSVAQLEPARKAL
jgi:ferrochelatase